MDFHYNDTDVSIEGNSQVLLFTCHEEVAELICELDTGVNVVSLA